MMRIYRIGAKEENVTFVKRIKADSCQDAKNKFKNEINKNNMSFPYIYPEGEIDVISRLFMYG